MIYVSTATVRCATAVLAELQHSLCINLCYGSVKVALAEEVVAEVEVRQPPLLFVALKIHLLQLRTW